MASGLLPDLAVRFRPCSGGGDSHGYHGFRPLPGDAGVVSEYDGETRLDMKSRLPGAGGFSRHNRKEETMKKSNALQELTRTPMSGVWSFSHGLSSHTLKIIAIMTMLTDHIAAVLMEGQASYWTLREIGRISFPIFCFLAAEGIAWTSNIFKYALRLGAFALHV